MIEAKLDRGRGPVATVLVQRGTLQVGDIVVAGAEWGRVRALVSDTGDPIDEAGPSTPVEVLGFSGTPEAGDRLAVVESEGARPRSHRLPRPPEAREDGRARHRHARLARADDGAAQDRGPQGIPAGRSRPTCRARSRRSSARSTSSAPTRSAARVIHSGVGGITESDVTLADASGAADHRLQRARPQGSARGGRARRRRNPLLQHHLRPRRRREEGDVGPARAGRCARPCSATRRSWRSSTSPRSARSPAAASPTARSSAAPTCA